MKRLDKTRELISELIEKDRELMVGRPIPDITIKEVSKELDLFEKNYSTYKLWSIITLLILLLILFIHL